MSFNPAIALTALLPAVGFVGLDWMAGKSNGFFLKNEVVAIDGDYFSRMWQKVETPVKNSLKLATQAWDSGQVVDGKVTGDTTYNNPYGLQAVHEQFDHQTKRQLPDQAKILGIKLAEDAGLLGYGLALGGAAARLGRVGWGIAGIGALASVPLYLYTKMGRQYGSGRLRYIAAEKTKALNFGGWKNSPIRSLISGHLGIDTQTDLRKASVFKIAKDLPTDFNKLTQKGARLAWFIENLEKGGTLEVLDKSIIGKPVAAFARKVKNEAAEYAIKGAT